ncbi:hypothetical protein EV384_3022 [Micromonospora kangleipakensis]|uniref:DUF6311 domain-containing protein n=1 Tax=Micromonospora kangleipakensis TaxID=1077942 RepID=A0A4Q8B9X7_9ACTN|nr:hypothetical protein [Micromonospora kangleipakensis]RZU74550.1 hypothetical protein EV384_3022 [Micromonospora kangleipakensis]
MTAPGARAHDPVPSHGAASAPQGDADATNATVTRTDERPGPAPAGTSDAVAGGTAAAGPASTRGDRTADTGRDAALAEPAAPPRLRRVDLLVALAYLAGALWVTARGWLDVDGRFLGARPDDQGFNEWMLAYAAHAVSQLENPFFTTLQNAPSGVNLMTNVGLQLPGLVLAPFTLLFGAPFSYLLFITLNLAGTGYAWYHVLSRHLVASRAAAFVGGLFCAFAPALVSHSNGHPHITAQWLVPFILWRVVRLARGGHVVRDGLVLGAFVTAQFFVSLEILFLTALGCAMVVVGFLVARPREALRRARPLLAGLAVTGVLVGLAAAYPLWMQFAGPQHRVGHPGNPDAYALKLGSYVRYATESIAGSPTSASGWAPNATEQASFYGWSLLVLALAAGWWLRREVVVRVLAVVAVVSAVLSVGTTWTWDTRRTTVPAPFALVDNLPVFDSMVAGRFALITTAALGVLLAVAGDRVAAPALRAQPAGRLAGGLAAVVALAALLPILPTPLPATGRPPVPDFVTSGHWREHVAPGRTLVPVPVADMTSLHWSTAALADFAVPQGYFLAPASATDPTGRWGVDPQPTAKLLTAVARGQRDTAVNPADVAQARADVRYWKADAVVLPRTHRRAALRTVLDALYGPGRQVDDVWLWDVRPYSR